MRNLKRVLALAMAMVMVLGMMVIGSSAASYSDESAINPDYAEAVEILSGMGIFQGTGNGFAPKAELDRASAAALIYRVITGDVNDKQVQNYDYASLNDVKAGQWYTGYVTYANNGGYIKGDDLGNFNPNAKVTGVQVLAIMLRAAGYGQNGEYEGAAWMDNILTDAYELGIIGKISSATLKAPATREVVAQLIFNAITKVDMVTYTPALGYIPVNLVSGAGRVTLAEKVFDLTSAASADKWGRPAVIWYNAGKGQVKGLYATIEETPLATYTTAVTECQIADDIDLDKVETFTMYTNGIVNDTEYKVQPLDTVQKIGAQGTLVEVYEDEIVVIDTFLAEVMDVKDATYDAAGHMKTPAVMKLAVYVSAATENATTYNVALTDAKANYTYAKGDMLLVNAYTNNDETYAKTTGEVTVRAIATTSTKVGTENLSVANYAEILGYAESMVGSQTILWYNVDQHTIEGTTYDNAAWLKLDEAQKSTAAHTWYFDQYGNVIGATDIATIYNYGIIEDIQWINPVGASGYAQATIRYMDGSTELKVVDKIDNKATAYAGWYGVGAIQTNTVAVSTDYDNNSALCGTDLYRIETTSKGTIELVHVFSVISNANVDNEINAATIKTGIAAIQGTKTGANAGTIYVNSDTVFLVQTVNGNKVSYAIVNGYENIANYTQDTDVTVDWVNLDGDVYAEYVYIIGDTDDAKTSGLFYLTSNNVKAVLNNKGSVDYYELTGIVDGVAGTIKVANAKDGNDELISLFDTVNRMYGVDYENGIVVNVRNSNNEILSGGVLVDYYTTNKAYTNQSISALKAANTAATYDGYVLAIGSNYYNVVGLEPVVGSWAPVLNGKEIYVIYDHTNTIDGAYVAKAVYIADPSTGIEDSGVAGATTGTVNYVVTMYMPDGSTVVRTATWTGTGSFGAGSQSFATIAPVHFSDLTTANWTVLQDQPAAINVTAGSVITLNYVINANNN